MIAAVLLLFTLSSSRLVGRDVCLDSNEARLVVSRLEDRLLLIESDSLCRLRHTYDSAALVAADTAYAKTQQALDLCLLSLGQVDSMRKSNIHQQPQTATSFLAGFGSGALTTVVLLLLWVLR